MLISNPLILNSNTTKMQRKQKNYLETKCTGTTSEHSNSEYRSASYHTHQKITFWHTMITNKSQLSVLEVPTVSLWCFSKNSWVYVHYTKTQAFVLRHNYWQYIIFPLLSSYLCLFLLFALLSAKLFPPPPFKINIYTHIVITMSSIDFNLLTMFTANCKQ